MMTQLPKRKLERSNPHQSELVSVRAIARKSLGLGLTLEELTEAGNSGLIHASETFDDSTGFTFCDYANWHISRFINEAIAKKNGVIKLPIQTIMRMSKREN